METPVQKSIRRVIAGSHDDEDIWEIVTAWNHHKLFLVSGFKSAICMTITKYFLGLRRIFLTYVLREKGVVSGKEIIVYGANARIIENLISEYLDNSIDNLVDRVRRRCRKEIQNSYNKVLLLNQKQVESEELYVETYLFERIIGKYVASISSLLEDFSLEENRLAMIGKIKKSPGLLTAERYGKLVILGKPGSGKSIFLQRLAIACSKEIFHPELIPILIELRDINDLNQFDIEELLHQKFRLNDRLQTRHILDTGRVLLLLDGLDEISDQARQKVQICIRRFSRAYYKNRVILTCRTQVVEQILDGFEYAEMADFIPQQVEIFVKKWFTAFTESPQQGTFLAETFIQKLWHPNNRQTAEIVVTPVLLSLACWIFQDLQDFPKDRTDLYERGVNLLLKQWDERRGIHRQFGSLTYRELSVEDKKHFLGYIALCKFKKKQFVLFEQREIQNYISDYLKISSEESQAILVTAEAQHGLLIERASQIYSFSHLTFQEYFAAIALCKLNNWQDVINHFSQRRWYPILSMLFSLYNADDSAQKMKAEIDNLLADDLAIQGFLKWLNDKTQLIKTPYRSAALRAFYFVVETSLNTNKYSIEYNYILIYALTLIRALILDLAPSLERIKDIDSFFTVDLKNNLDRVLDRILSQTLTYGNIDQSGDRALARSALIVPLLYRILIDDLTHAIQFSKTLDLELKGRLQELKKQLPHPSWKDRDILKRWWEMQGLKWTEQLREVLVERRNIGHNWQFNKSQKQLLQRFYDANKLLISCLKLKNAKVSLDVRQKIEESLFLPMTLVEEGGKKSSKTIPNSKTETRKNNAHPERSEPAIGGRLITVSGDAPNSISITGDNNQVTVVKNSSDCP
jgi:predicted NACHT family NTPase